MAICLERKNYGVELRVCRLNESFRSNSAKRSRLDHDRDVSHDLIRLLNKPGYTSAG